MRLKLIALIALCISVLHVAAQEKSNIKFGKITADDFKQATYAIDSNANAVVIADIGSTEMLGNTKGGFSLEFKKFRRVHILNKNGYGAANVEINIYTNGNAEEDLTSLKAVTYNLENGKVTETKLETKSAVFKDRINKNLVVKKFTFPNIKEGSIIEYQYKLNSDFIFNLQGWDFQGDIPCLWSEYVVSIPEFYYYISITQGYTEYDIADTKSKTASFTVIDNAGSATQTERTSFNAGVTDFRWVRKNVPALKQESYTSNLSNHKARIEFQLAELRAPFTPKAIMRNWPQAATELLNDEEFGSTLYRDNGWLSDAVKEATAGAVTELEKARNIFTYVRDNFACTNYNGKYLQKSLKNVLKSKNGTEAEINLLLTAMMAKAGLKADPVMLSTRSNGFGYVLYPVLSRFNYIISRVSAGNRFYYLDASHPRLGFDRLEYEAYNGYARVINEEAMAVPFIADSLAEAKVSSIIISNADDGGLIGSMKQSPGYYESYSLRNRIKDKGKDQLFADIRKAFNADIEMTGEFVDSLDKYEQPLKLGYSFNLKKAEEDILYFNPMFGEAWKENPFKSAVRNYPVEMPYTIDEVYLLTLNVPTGYQTDELPKQIMVKLNEENEGYFEYRVSESNGIISLRSRICLKRAFFQPDEYEMLREFFNLVVKKHAEQIVFKKKS